jgi:hypothetical protein
MLHIADPFLAETSTKGKISKTQHRPKKEALMSAKGKCGASMTESDDMDY